MLCHVPVDTDLIYSLYLHYFSIESSTTSDASLESHKAVIYTSKILNLAAYPRLRKAHGL
jgi:hypothetical protein